MEPGVRGRQRRPMEGGEDGETDQNSGLGKKGKVSQVCLLSGGGVSLGVTFLVSLSSQGELPRVDYRVCSYLDRPATLLGIPGEPCSSFLEELGYQISLGEFPFPSFQSCPHA